MNNEDELIVWNTFRQMDHELQQALEIVAHKYFKRIEKETFFDMGYRTREPMSKEERFQDFKDFIETVYIRPSI